MFVLKHQEIDLHQPSVANKLSQEVTEVSKLKENIFTCPKVFGVTKNNKYLQMHLFFQDVALSQGNGCPKFSDSAVVSFSWIKKSRTNHPGLSEP
jgi:hypothetical protein